MHNTPETRCPECRSYNATGRPAAGPLGEAATLWTCDACGCEYLDIEAADDDRSMAARRRSKRRPAPWWRR